MVTLRVTHRVNAVLQALAAAPEEGMYGFQLLNVSEVPASTLYPVLDRLERHGFATSTWESSNPTVAGRPRRLYWKLTPKGYDLAKEVIQ